MTVLATFARIYTDDLDATIRALSVSGLDGVRLRFGHRAGLQLALVGDVLVLAGTPDQLAPFRDTQVTLIVDDLEDQLTAAVAAGALVVREPAEQATGRNATVRFGPAPGGYVFEYVEWNADTRAQAGLAV